MLRSRFAVHRTQLNASYLTLTHRCASSTPNAGPTAGGNSPKSDLNSSAPDATSAVAETANASTGFVSDAADALVSAHGLLSMDGTLLGWTGTLVGAAIAARAVSLPLLYYSQIQHARAARATKELARVQAFVRGSPGSLFQKYLSFRRLRSVALRSAGTSPGRLFPWYVGVNVPIFVTTSLAIRKLSSEPPSEWKGAGWHGWFDDLSASDPTGALPVINTALWLYNAHRRRPGTSNTPDDKEAPKAVQASEDRAVNDDRHKTTQITRKEGSRGKPVSRQTALDRLLNGETATTGIQALALFSFPFVQHAPSAMFVFWITSGTLTAMQRAVLGSDWGRRALRLPTAKELSEAANSDGPAVLGATGRAVRAVRDQLEYVQSEVLTAFAKRGVDETLREDVNRSLRREKRRGRINIDLEAIVREDPETGRKYLAVVRKGTAM